MMLYFVIYKQKKEKKYRMFTNVVFDKEKDAEHFGKSSMKKGFEHKVLEYDSENHNRYWNEKDR